MNPLEGNHIIVFLRDFHKGNYSVILSGTACRKYYMNAIGNIIANIF